MDIVSDLHIDHWDVTINVKYPCCERIHHPFNLIPQSDILIVVGDISDDLELSLKYLDDISKYYKKVLFVDGNHEHVNIYPELYSIDYINTKIKELNNDKIVYLSKESYKFNDTVIIGCNGWWDYSDGINKDYFKEWIPHIDNDIFLKNVMKRAEEEYEYIKQQLKIYSKVIVVTHTLPYPLIKDNLSTEMNSMMKYLIKDNITHWIFGHTHKKINTKINNTQLISHPRGRLGDGYKNYDVLRLIN